MNHFTSWTMLSAGHCMCKAIQITYCKLYLVNLDNRKGYKQSWSFLYCLKLFSSRLSYLSSLYQNNFTLITVLTN